MGEMFSMPFRNSMKVPLVGRGQVGGRRAREKEKGPEFKSSPTWISGGTRSHPQASQGPSERPAPFLAQAQEGQDTGWVGPHRFLGSLSRAM